jgi:hypothetical protein
MHYYRLLLCIPHQVTRSPICGWCCDQAYQEVEVGEFPALAAASDEEVRPEKSVRDTALAHIPVFVHRFHIYYHLNDDLEVGEFPALAAASDEEVRPKKRARDTALGRIPVCVHRSRSGLFDHFGPLFWMT